jgi:hypoxanthine phosphoribosyltransferase
MIINLKNSVSRVFNTFAFPMQTVRIYNKEFEAFITADQISRRVSEIASLISAEYAGKNPLFIGVLNGAVIFLADLIRQITIDCELTFIKVASYEGLESTGNVNSLIGLDKDIKDRHVIITEDVIDSGATAKYILDEITALKPASVKFASVLFKPAALRFPVNPDFSGFQIPDDFVVGYGLDYQGLGRNFSHIYKLKA